MAYLCGGKILKIFIYPLGGISKFSISYNISLWKEFLILVFGPIFQMLAWLILLFLFPDKRILITTYHFGILFFNLLPIYPLDGGKLLCLLCHFFVSYKRAFYFTIFFGYFLIFCFCYYYFISFSFNILFLVVFLFIKLSQEFKQVPYYYEKFLLERYLNCYHFNKSKIIDSLNKFQREYRHLVKNNSFYYTEKEYLQKKYKRC